MASVVSLEVFVNAIRQLYEQHSQNPKMPGNYTDVYNCIQANLDLLSSQNASNLFDNVLPIFSLPEFTLPHMAVLYALATPMQQQQQSSSAPSSTTGSTTAVRVTSTTVDVAQQTSGQAATNQERLVNHVDNCLKLADDRQVE